MTSAEQLGPDGPFAQADSHFAPRPVQQALATAVEDSLADDAILVAEAGTGTGKTYAYLVPALQSGLRTLVSTGTKTLQDQLFHRDLPQVIRHLELQPKTALLKGRANYLCLERFEQTRHSGRISAGQSSELAAVSRWSADTRDGDLSSTDLLADDSRLWPRVTSTAENCLGSQCPHFEDCFVVKARRRAQEADVVVVNHHLLLADMALKEEGFGEVLPGAEAIVVDEAHQLPEIASRFFSRSLTSRMLRELSRDTLAAAGEETGLAATFMPLCSGLDSTRKSLDLALQSTRSARGPWRDAAGLAPVQSALDEMDEALVELSEKLESVAQVSATLSACHDRSQRFIDRLRALDDWQNAEDSVAWFERERGFSLHQTPLSIAEPFARHQHRTEAAWIFTSATLTVKQSFSHFRQQLGLEDAREFQAGSPFDYARQTRLWLPSGLPSPGSRDHDGALLRQVLPLLEANQGRAFLLFTSHRALRHAADWLRHRSRLPLFVQGEAARSVLLDEFRSAGNGILLGAASFWEGVDVPGSALSIVVIDKLPFAAPDDPVLEARLSAIREQGGSPFTQLQLPQAVIALKQGAGRLIRDTHDFGVLVLGDPRITSKGYGKVFLTSLPPMPRAQSAADVIDFLQQRAAA